MSTVHLEAMPIQELIGYARGLEYALERIGGMTARVETKYPTISIIRTLYGDVQITKEAQAYLDNIPYPDKDAVIKEMINRAEGLAHKAFCKNGPIPSMDWP